LTAENQSNNFQTIIIGGGASGLVATIVAARRKQDVLIVEKNIDLGEKILVTGNGRCNLTNINVSSDKYYGENTKCLHNIFNRFSYNDTIEFFEELGVKLKIEPDGRVFPASNQASTVLAALERELSRLQVKIKLGERVTRLSLNKTDWQVSTDKNIYQSKSVILTCGGKSYVQLGTTGDGYEIARKLGHRIVEPKSALVPLELDGTWYKDLQGIQVNVELILKQENKHIKRTGDLLFTHFGISGPVVLDISRLVSKNDNGLFVNFFPTYKNSKELESFLNINWQSHPRKTILNSLAELLPKKLCAILLNILKIDLDKQVSQINQKERKLITEQFMHWQVSVKNTRSFAEAMVSAGGVALDEINPKTMESLKAPGLYFAGEILDIDGISGGYNLQFAWSTGYLAGFNC
jgi:predicted Rossmann fold flavoprotein